MADIFQLSQHLSTLKQVGDLLPIHISSSFQQQTMNLQSLYPITMLVVKRVKVQVKNFARKLIKHLYN